MLQVRGETTSWKIFPRHYLRTDFALCRFFFLLKPYPDWTTYRVSLYSSNNGWKSMVVFLFNFKERRDGCLIKAEWNENLSQRLFIWLFLSLDEAPNKFGRSIGETQRSPLVRKQGVSFRVISGLYTHFPYTRNVLKFRPCDNKPESIPLEFGCMGEFLSGTSKPHFKTPFSTCFLDI